MKRVLRNNTLDKTLFNCILSKCKTNLIWIIINELTPIEFADNVNSGICTLVTLVIVIKQLNFGSFADLTTQLLSKKCLIRLSGAPCVKGGTARNQESRVPIDRNATRARFSNIAH
ncbi:hypothetical protein WA026_004316 [Henosepilachna vigintioctopunctata]|uniref:Uncharacterized protein n=1 Tax=Henosepilachna vigintioctopunctata TaxID=420089 RepID=A0AAW1V6K2_9CUCU